jgi:hypothetical protein
MARKGMVFAAVMQYLQMSIKSASIPDFVEGVAVLEKNSTFAPMIAQNRILISSGIVASDAGNPVVPAYFLLNNFTPPPPPPQFFNSQQITVFFLSDASRHSGI